MIIPQKPIEITSQKSANRLNRNQENLKSNCKQIHEKFLHSKEKGILIYTFFVKVNPLKFILYHTMKTFIYSL